METRYRSDRRDLRAREGWDGEGCRPWRSRSCGIAGDRFLRRIWTPLPRVISTRRRRRRRRTATKVIEGCWGGPFRWRCSGWWGTWAPPPTSSTTATRSSTTGSPFTTCSTNPDSRPGSIGFPKFPLLFSSFESNKWYALSLSFAWNLLSFFLLIFFSCTGV